MVGRWGERVAHDSQAALLWRLYRSHWRRQYRVLSVDEAIWRRAEALIFVYPLRAYDALRIASALRAAVLAADLGPELRFCTADRGQAQAAAQEGLAVEIVG